MFYCGEHKSNQTPRKRWMGDEWRNWRWPPFFHLLTVLYRDTLLEEKQRNIGQWIIEVYGKITDSLQSLSTRAISNKWCHFMFQTHIMLLFTQTQHMNIKCFKIDEMKNWKPILHYIHRKFHVGKMHVQKQWGKVWKTLQYKQHWLMS